MMGEPTNNFTHIGVDRKTQLQISILAKITPASQVGEKTHIYDLVGTWANTAWEQAKKDGLVTDAMLSAHWVQPPAAKKSKKVVAK